MTTGGDLLRGIAEAPNDLATWRAFADWAEQHGNPRGELIALELAIEAEPLRRDLPLARDLHLVKHGAGLLGDTLARGVADGYVGIAWRRGFVDSLQYAGDARLRHRRAVGWLVPLLDHEALTFVRRLAFPYTDLADLAPLRGFAQLVEVDIVGCPVRDPRALGPRVRIVGDYSQPGT